MAIVPINSIVKTVETGAGQTVQLIFAWNKYQAYSDEEYKTNPEIYFHQTAISYYSYKMSEYCEEVDLSSASITYGNRAVISIESVIRSGQLMVYTDPGLTLSHIGTFSGEAGQTLGDWGDIDFEPYTNYANLPARILGYKDSRVSPNSFYWYVSTNIPIFETDADAAQYMQYGDNIQNAINNNVPSVEGRYFEIINIWTEGTWDANGFTPATGATQNFRCVRGRVDDEPGIVMWAEPGINNGGLIYGVKNTESAHDMQYSEDGVTWQNTATFPYNYFYRPRVDEVGTFKFALTYYTNRVPIFEDEDTADDYINGDAPITDAINYTDISNDYPGSDTGITNNTGDPDDGTDWGSVYTRSFFHNIYLLGEGALSEISNALYDTTPGGKWEDIKKGIEMFGDNPIESVFSLMYFPLDLDSVFTNSGATSNIYFGGYNFQMQNNTANQVIYLDGYYVCGSVYIEPTFGNWRDIKAMRLFIDLPYCGRYELDTQKYIGKTIKVVYYIDLHSGACLACLVEGGSASDNEGTCLDQYNGIIGEKLPITLTDFSGHANNIINTLLGNGGQAVNSGLNVANEAGMATSALGLASAGGAAAAIGGITAAKTVYGLQMNNINKFNQTRGGSSGMLNQYANQRPTFIFVYPEADIPSNFTQMYGNPSNAGGSISQFYGYFEADTVKLNVPGATENEKGKIRDLLMNGVFIQ